MPTLKKLSLFVLILLQGNLMLAQDRKDGEYNTFSFKGQQNPEIWVMMYARKRSWGLGQQFYGIQIENITDKKLKIKGTYYAILTCGNEVSSEIDVILGPHQKLGGNSFATDATGLTASAESEDCKGTPIYESGKQVGTNRIKSVGYQITEITDMALKQNSAEDRRQLSYKAPASTTPASGAPRSTQSTSNIKPEKQEGSNNNIRVYLPTKGEMALQQTRGYINQKQQQAAQITNTLTEGLQNIGSILEQGRQRRAAEAAETRSRERASQFQNEEWERERKAYVINKAAEGETKYIVDYGLIKLIDYNDAKTAHVCFLAGAKVDNPKAMFWLSIDYEKGLGVEKNDSLAAYWLRRSADCGNLNAMNRLAKYLSYGGFSTIIKNTDEAIKWYSMIFFLKNSLDKSESLALGTYFNNVGDKITDTEQKALTQLGNVGYSEQFDLNFQGNKFYIISELTGLYEQKGTAPDIECAIVWQKMRRSISTEESIIWRKRYIKESENKIKELEKLLKKASVKSNNGNSASMEMFSKAFRELYTPGKLDSAIYYFSLAAEQGDCEAIFILAGLLWKKGQEPIAGSWYQKMDEKRKCYMSSVPAARYYTMANDALNNVNYSRTEEYYQKSTTFIGIDQLLSAMALENAYRTGYFAIERYQKKGPIEMTVDINKADIWKQKIKQYRLEDKILEFRN